MVNFESNVNSVLHYDREQYLNFFDEDSDYTLPDWYGTSLQLERIRNDKLYGVTDNVLTQSIDILEQTFKTIVSLLDQNLTWVINHDDKDMPWFLKEDEKLPDLRNLFSQNNIPDTYRGCLIVLKQDLVLYARDLVTYPYSLSYKNLDVSHSKLPIIIKTTGHLTLDLLSTDRTLLNEVLANHSLRSFTKINYRTR